VVDFSDFNCVVSQEVVPNELEVHRLDEESENFSIVVQELFLRGHPSSSELLLEVLKELLVLFRWDWLLRLSEFVKRALTGWLLRLVDVLYQRNGYDIYKNTA